MRYVQFTGTGLFAQSASFKTQLSTTILKRTDNGYSQSQSNLCFGRAAAFSNSGKSDSGFTDLAFSICGVSGQCYEYIKQALNSQSTTLLTLKQWHPETEAELYTLTLTVTGGQLTRDTANFTASFCDMLNTEFPKLRYTAYNAPGLKYVA